MNLETHMIVWKVEARAHGYAGFIVIKDSGKEYDRVFLNSESELEPALASMRVHGHNVVQTHII